MVPVTQTSTGVHATRRWRKPDSNPRSLGLSASVAATELFKGGPEPNRVIILEFADRAAVKRWYNSPEYQKILPGRLDNSTGRAFIVEGAS